MLRLDQTLPESSLLMTAVHFPISLFKTNLLLGFTVLERKQATLLNTVTKTHLEYLRNTWPPQNIIPIVWPYKHFIYFMTFYKGNSIFFQVLPHLTTTIFIKLSKNQDLFIQINHDLYFCKSLF